MSFALSRPSDDAIRNSATTAACRPPETASSTHPGGVSADQVEGEAIGFFLLQLRRWPGLPAKAYEPDGVGLPEEAVNQLNPFGIGGRADLLEGHASRD